MIVKLSIVLKCVAMIYMVSILLVSPVFTLSENTTIELIINSTSPIVVQYDNESKVISGYNIIEVLLPANICLPNHTNACIKLWSSNKLYALSIDANNSISLLVSQIDISVKEIEIRKVRYVSGEGLIILIKLWNNTNNVNLKSLVRISEGYKFDMTPISSIKVDNNVLYINVNYDRGRLPFIEFKNGDIVKTLLYMGSDPLELVILLREKEELSRNEHSTHLYTRVSNSFSNSLINSTRTMAQYIRSDIGQSGSSQIYKNLTNPLFIIASFLIVVSIIVLYRVENRLK